MRSPSPLRGGQAELLYSPVHEFVHGRWGLSTTQVVLFSSPLQEFVQRKDFSPKTMAGFIV
jgi:hypothetical protein